MTSKLLFFGILLISNLTFAQTSPTIKVDKQVRQLSVLSGEMVTKVKLAKEYYMTSSDSAAGNTFEERTANLSKIILVIFNKFREDRVVEYRKVGFQFSSSDWATGHQVTKNVRIPSNTYTFTKITRNTNGDWKDGPIINGVNRKNWFEGDINGGSVSWTTGGHKRAVTKWTIFGKYSEKYINKTLDNEILQIKKILSSQNLPTE